MTQIARVGSIPLRFLALNCERLDARHPAAGQGQSLVGQLGCQPDTKATIAFCTPKPTASSTKLAAARTQEGRGDRSIRRAAVTSASKPKIPSSNVTWGTSGRPRSMSMPLPNGMSWSTKPDTRKVATSAAGREEYRRSGRIGGPQSGAYPPPF